MEKVLSIRPNRPIMTLFERLQKHQTWANRREITSAAIQYAYDSQSNNWNEIAELTKYEIGGEVYGGKMPDFMQIKVNEEQYTAVREQIIRAFPDNEKAPPAPYIIRLILSNYLLHLEAFENEHIQASALTLTEEDILCVKKEEYEKFERLNIDEKLNAIYKKLLELK